MNKRINDLEFKVATYLCEPPEYPDYHINKYYPNGFYGREKDFIKDGDFYVYPEHPNCRVHKNCFKNPQSCYAIAGFHRDREGYYELQFIGDRPLDLTPEELKDFWELIKFGYEVLNNKEEDKEF